MSQKINWIGLIAVLLIGINSLPRAEADKTTSALAKYIYTYAYQNCAPWDGPAISITFVQKPYQRSKKTAPRLYALGMQLPKTSYPQYTLSLYRQKPLPHQQWILLEGNQGHVSWCPSKGQCKPVKARIRLTREDTAHLEGLFQLVPENPGSQEQTLPFQAPILPYTPLCG